MFHHIEEWAKQRSNAEQYLITVCDKCHRGIHGEGGNLFSKAELYKSKNNPQKPLILKDKLPLEAKRGYSFFIGSNFIEHGERANLIGFQGGHRLTTIDTSSGILKLSILGGIRDGNPIFVIKDNELVIDTQDLWDMHYSRNSLKIWRLTDGKKVLFINLILLPDVIVISELNSGFNGIPLRIFKLRSPQKRQLEKVAAKVKLYEGIFLKESKRIDSFPQIYGTHDGIDIDATCKQTEKDLIKTRLEQGLMFEFCKSFKWRSGYYQKVLHELLHKSTVFRKTRAPTGEIPAEVERIQEEVLAIRQKYSKHFEELKNVVLEFDGLMFDGTIIV